MPQTRRALFQVERSTFYSYRYGLGCLTLAQLLALRSSRQVYRAAAQAALAPDGEGARRLTMKALLSALAAEKKKGRGIVHDIVQAQYL